jgi:ligand-binding sensor domain-containing protein/signal transduction histidine kinase
MHGVWARAESISFPGSHFTLLAVVTGLAVSLQASARSAEFSERVWTREHGLPNGAIHSILPTRDGYLWLSTERGLARFDGLKLTVFDRANTPEMTEESYGTLVEDSQGRLWVGARKGALVWLGDRFVRVAGRPESLAHQVHPICFRRDGSVWLGTFAGIHIFSSKGLAWLGETELEAGRNVLSLAEDDDSRLWIGTQVGLLMSRSGHDSFERVEHPALAKACVWRMHRDRAGTLWALAGQYESHHARLYAFRNGQWSAYDEPVLGNGGRSFFIASDRRGDLWMSGDRGGLLRFDGRQFHRHPLDRGDKDEFATCAAEDREGNLWIGTESGRLLRWRPRRIEVLDARRGLPHDEVKTICPARDGSVWIGTDGGLTQIRDGTVRHFTTTNGLRENNVRSLSEDRDGALWIGTRKGLERFQDGRFTRYQFPGDWHRTKILSLLSAGDGSLWAGTVAGVHQVRTEDLAAAGGGADSDTQIVSSRHFLAPVNQTVPAFLSLNVRALLEDRLGQIWAGVHGYGVCLMRSNPPAWLTGSNGLSSDFIRTLHQDADGAVWIGSDAGLDRFASNRVTTFRTGDGLPDSAINSLLEDDFGRLWLGTPQGIASVSKRELNDLTTGTRRRLHCVAYGEEDGLPTLEISGEYGQPAAAKTRDGRLWFATSKGVAILDPRQLPDVTNPPPVVIANIRANGQTVFDNNVAARDASFAHTGGSLSPSDGERGNASPRLTDPLALLSKPGVSPLAAEIQFPPGGAHFLEFGYTAPTFVASDQVRFRYQLEGVDPDWIDAGPRRAAYYANLKPGSYRFRVEAMNKYGVWSASPAVLAFHLQPHFYETRTFYALCAAALLAAALGLHRWRSGYVRRIHALQQANALTQERARIAKDLHDGLGANLTQLTLLAELAEQEPHQAVAQRLRGLATTSREAARNLKDFIWATHPEADTLDGLVTRLCQHAEEFLGTAQIRCRLELPDEIPPHPLTAAARNDFFLAAKEALNNVVKHARATEVRLRVRHDGLAFRIVIEDNGCGFNSQASPPNPQPTGAGHGLGNMASRVQSAGGRFTLESQPGRGTTIAIEIPIPRHAS